MQDTTADLPTMTPDDVARVFDVPVDLVTVGPPRSVDEPTELEYAADPTPKADITLDLPHAVITVRWFDEWTVPTAEEMGQLLRTAAAASTPTGIDRFRANLREQLIAVADLDSAQARELRDASLRVEVMMRDQFRCRYCGAAVLFHEGAVGRHPVPAGVDVAAGLIRHVMPEIAAGAANLVVTCASCAVSKGDQSPDEAGMRLLPCPSRPEHIIGAAVPGDGPPMESVSADPDSPTAAASAPPPVGFRIPAESVPIPAP